MDVPITRALISVTDKTGVVEFAKALVDEFDVEIISTGGTKAALEAAGVPVTGIEAWTGFPEMLDGRVKTLHPKVHGALLARRDDVEHMLTLAEHNIGLIDLVCVNLYQFEKAVEDPDITYEDAIEKFDIGGPSMLRSAAKNADSVTVASSPDQYGAILEEMRANGGSTSLGLRRELQREVYALTAAYDAAIANWLAGYAGAAATENAHLRLAAEKAIDLRYGENPHQKAAFYKLANAGANSLARAELVQGKPLSYNNLLDTDAAWGCVREFDEPACVILKHQNPCGSAVADGPEAAYVRAYECDPVSAYGGIVAMNRTVDLATVERMFDVNRQFVEVLIAPSYTPDALERLARRKNLRVLATGGVARGEAYELRSVDGGVLLQEVDTVDEDPAEFECVTKRVPSEKELSDLVFAWKVVKTVKSNAILVAKDKAGIGLGPGQPNRVDSAMLACDRAREALGRTGGEVKDLVAASDAFFPFRDGIDELADRGITAIVQPGGSVRDDEVIEACDERGIAMLFTHVRHFRH